MTGQICKCLIIHYVTDDLAEYTILVDSMSSVVGCLDMVTEK